MNYEPACSTSIIVPTYQERGNIRPLGQRVFAALAPVRCELLIIDDNSPDGTAAEVAAVAAAEGWPLRCIVRTDERGLATAVIRGLREATGAWLVVMDADLSHPPEAIPQLLAPLADPAVHMTLGSRFVAGSSVDQGWPLLRRLNSFGARLLARPLTPVRDMMSGFFAVRKADLRLADLRPIGYKIALELIVRHRWKNVVEVPITFADRTIGQTKLNLAEQFRYLRHLGRLYAFAALGRAARSGS